MTATVAITMPAVDAALHSCPNCGFDIPITMNHEIIPLDAQQQIEDLQAQVRLLTEKATAAGKFT